MLYTIAEAANVMGLEESVIVKGIEDGVITATKKVSGEWHIDDVELNLLYLYLARDYCKHQWRTDPRRSRGNNQEAEIATIADSDEAIVEQQRNDTRTVADLAEAGPTISATQSRCQQEIRIDDRDRISASDRRRAFQAHRV